MKKVLLILSMLSSQTLFCANLAGVTEEPSQPNNVALLMIIQMVASAPQTVDAIILQMMQTNSFQITFPYQAAVSEKSKHCG